MKQVWMRRLGVICCVVFAGVLGANAAWAGSAEKSRKDKDPCAKLPAVIEFDAGKKTLKRREDFRWDYVSDLPKVNEFFYSDPDDGHRVYRFWRWTGSQYSCSDTGRFAR